MNIGKLYRQGRLFSASYTTGTDGQRIVSYTQVRDFFYSRKIKKADVENVSNSQLVLKQYDLLVRFATDFKYDSVVDLTFSATTRERYKIIGIEELGREEGFIITVERIESRTQG